MRAIALLSQREHSPQELRRKLLRIRAEQALRKAREQQAGSEPQDAEDDDDKEAAAQEVDGLIAWLHSHGYLSETRFVESRVNARAARYGTQRIRQELAQHGLVLDAEQQAQLRASELERARAVWSRKFGRAATAPDRLEMSRQARFLGARGFAPDVIRRLLDEARRPADEADEGE
ncbi:regulatory protein RecX [Pelomonas sp. KK5]|uniref:regulatory protein RecX n=1 Tax=Pelomonas sp. KK5 TaxID=1855730 RepID=UPI003512A4D5